MPIATILGLITGLAELTKTIVPLVEQVETELNETDLAAVQTALDTLHAANATLYAKVQTELRGS